MVDLSLNLEVQSNEELSLRQQLDLFLQEIEVVLHTSSTDIYGHPKVLNLRKYVFSKSVSNYQVSNEVRNYIQENCYHSKYFNFDVTTDFIQGRFQNDIMYIKFDIYLPDKTVFKRQFMITQ